MKLLGFDLEILLSVLILSVISLVMIWSLETSLFLTQVSFVIIGFAFFYLFSKLDFRIFENLTTPLYVISMVLLFLTFLLGEVTRGSVRWLNLGFFNLQPSEAVKPFLVMFFASQMAKENKWDLKPLLKIALLVILPILFIFKQPDLGSALVLLASFAGIVLSSRIPKSYLLIGIILILLLTPVGWSLLESYQKARIFSFLNPYSDPLGSGYHIIQSVITVGSGGFLGRGLGMGTQSQLSFLPEHHTDFIFASLAEELGFLGAMMVIVSYFVLLYKILTISHKSDSLFGSLIGFGIFSQLLFQVFVNIGMNIGIMPITGITLPLVSYGGSSFVSIMISLGIVESIAKAKKFETAIEIR